VQTEHLRRSKKLSMPTDHNGRLQILSVSYDADLLHARHLLLQNEGYDVISVLGFTEPMNYCEKDEFDLLILGHSIPHLDKEVIAEAFSSCSDAPIIALKTSGELPLDNIAFHADPDPQVLLDLVAKIFMRQRTRSK